MKMHAGMASRPRAANFGRGLLDILLPPRCLGCSSVLAGEVALCAPCWSQVRFIEAPCCASCGRPFDFAFSDNGQCVSCFARPPLFQTARAVLVHEGKGRDLVHAFKYSDRLDAAQTFGLWMTRAGAAQCQDADFVIPVPLHWTRFLRRRFNQAAELARVIGHLSGRPVKVHLLKRKRATPSQVGLSARARRRNVAGAFTLSRGAQDIIRGRRVVLVDDVMTTGATLEACTRLLVSAGVARVDVLTLSRVMAPSDVSVT